MQLLTTRLERANRTALTYEAEMQFQRDIALVPVGPITVWLVVTLLSIYYYQYISSAA